MGENEEAAINRCQSGDFFQKPDKYLRLIKGEALSVGQVRRRIIVF